MLVEVANRAICLLRANVVGSNVALRKCCFVQMPLNQNDQVFVGLCNFFRAHIKGFCSDCSPNIQTHKEGLRLEESRKALFVLQRHLTSEPVMAFPKSDQKSELITDAVTRTAKTQGGLGAILNQVDKVGNVYAISFASRHFKDHEKNYLPFLLEATAAVWGIDIFSKYF